MDQTEHKIVESMGANWDAGGYRPPTNWHVICSCGWKARALRDQTAAADAWTVHRDAVSAPRPQSSS